jgi:cellulose synthase/poly-beta-1,6-N-acetylglucosamine synthase-like glycosyltransferase
MYQKLDERISLHVLTEAANAHNFDGMFKKHVSIHAVPSAYSPVKAKYKARNLEWFRINMHLDQDDWVLHLDEETLVDEYCLNTCLDFITKQSCDMGQVSQFLFGHVTDTYICGKGVIHFNCNDFWSSVFTGVGDVHRIQGDYGDVQWRLCWLNRAAVGIRGSFLLIRGSVENACTWDNNSLTEDYSFCLKVRLKKSVALNVIFVIL